MTLQSTVRRMAVRVHGPGHRRGDRRLIVELARGVHAFAAIAVYGVTASLGIEFLVAAWPSLWDAVRRTS